MVRPFIHSHDLKRSNDVRPYFNHLDYHVSFQDNGDISVVEDSGAIAIKWRDFYRDNLTNVSGGN